MDNLETKEIVSILDFPSKEQDNDDDNEKWDSAGLDFFHFTSLSQEGVIKITSNTENINNQENPEIIITVKNQKNKIMEVKVHSYYFYKDDREKTYTIFPKNQKNIKIENTAPNGFYRVVLIKPRSSKSILPKLERLIDDRRNSLDAINLAKEIWEEKYKEKKDFIVAIYGENGNCIHYNGEKTLMNEYSCYL